MRGWSIPFGQWAGVELRVHFFLPLVAIVFFSMAGDTGWQGGFSLFLYLLLALATREAARLIVAARLGLRLRAVLLLPIGSLFAYANPESQEKANKGSALLALSLAGPLANLATGFVLAGAALGASNGVQLFAFPLLSASALLRSVIWMQWALAVLHLLPAYPLDCGRFVRSLFDSQNHASMRAATGLGQGISLAIILAGIYLRSPWLILAGLFILIGAQIENQGVFFQSVVDTVLIREIMLTDFSTLSPSDTLADALARSVHCLQEDFPVVRGSELVGIVNRQKILDTLHRDGNTYVQSAMSRVQQSARPSDTLGAAIRGRATSNSFSLIPVTEAGRVVGIVSIQNLMNAMPLLAEQRRIDRQNDRD